MRFYSEKTKRMYDSVDLLETAEKEFDEKKDSRKIFTMFLEIGIERKGLDSIEDLKEILIKMFMMDLDIFPVNIRWLKIVMKWVA